MSACITCSRRWVMPVLSPGTTTIMAAITAMTFSACGAAPTPLFHQYQESFGLTPFAITVIFAAYVLSLLGALLTVGSLSDYVGRRPAILTALGLNVVAMGLFITADSAGAITAARVLQGFATGLATAAIAAAILDNDSKRGAILNSITAFGGLTVGSLGGGILATYAPHPGQLIYGVLSVVSVIDGILLWFMPETVPPRAGALASLRPHVRIPRRAFGVLLRLTPVTVASWALGGFYFSLMPSLIRVATGVTPAVVGGFVVSTLTLSGAASVLVVRSTAPDRVVKGGIVALALGVIATLAGVHQQLVLVMIAGTVTSGAGFGAAFSSTLRTVLPLAGEDERAGLVAAFYVEGYLSFSIPAVVASLAVPSAGLVAVAWIYGLTVVALAVLSMLAMWGRD